MSAPRILFVCLGNICRSPLVEQVAREAFVHAGIEVAVASCGTGGWHAGQGADPRMIAAAREAGHDLSAHRARQLRARDYVDFDWLLAMDADNLHELRERAATPVQAARTALFLEWSQATPPAAFPDPWYGEAEDFAAAVQLAERGVASLVRRLQRGA